jgi:hypothetical protein
LAVSLNRAHLAVTWPFGCGELLAKSGARDAMIPPLSKAALPLTFDRLHTGGNIDLVPPHGSFGGDLVRMHQMFRDQLRYFEKTEPAWSNIALFGNNVIIAAGMIGFLLIAVLQTRYV